MDNIIGIGVETVSYKIFLYVNAMNESRYLEMGPKAGP